MLSGIAVLHIFTDIWRTACQIDAPVIYLVFRSGRINCTGKKPSLARCGTKVGKDKTKSPF